MKIKCIKDYNTVLVKGVEYEILTVEGEERKNNALSKREYMFNDMLWEIIGDKPSYYIKIRQDSDMLLELSKKEFLEYFDIVSIRSKKIENLNKRLKDS